MTPELEETVTALVRSVYGGRVLPTPDWIQRPGRLEVGRRWKLVRTIYAELTDMALPDVMPPRERRTLDCVLQRSGEPPRIIEFDETQHFNRYRALTIRGIRGRFGWRSTVEHGSRRATPSADWRAVASDARSHRCSRMTTEAIGNARIVTRWLTSFLSSTGGFRRSA
jgi:hypothetical protein